MGNSVARTTIKEKLILAGIDEIGRHGISDFSLRQVALSCKLSCATPYNYFNSKESFIREIRKYVKEQWGLLKSEIIGFYGDDEKAMLAEICVYFIKFLIANPNYRAIISTEGTRDFMEPELEQYLKLKFQEELEVKRKAFVIRAIVFEAALLFESNELENCEESFDFVRYCVKKEL